MNYYHFNFSLLKPRTSLHPSTFYLAPGLHPHKSIDFLVSGNITSIMFPRGKHPCTRASSSLHHSPATFVATSPSQANTAPRNQPVAPPLAPNFPPSSPNHGNAPSNQPHTTPAPDLHNHLQHHWRPPTPFNRNAACLRWL